MRTISSCTVRWLPESRWRGRPQSSAARLFPQLSLSSQTPLHAASNAGSPRARHAAINAGEDVSGASAREPGRSRWTKAKSAIGGSNQKYRRPSKTTTAPERCAASRARSALVPASWPKSRSNSPSCGVMIASWPFSRSGLPRCVIPSASMTFGARDVSAKRQHLRDIAQAGTHDGGSRMRSSFTSAMSV